MPNYRRSRTGSTYFFTIVTESRQRILTSEHARDALRNAFAETQTQMPFHVDAIVVLEDHLHTIWTLPESDTNYSTRLALLKKTFTQTYLQYGGTEQPVRASKARKRERGVWQRRFWEHTIQTDERYARLMDYIHYNPVKHGYVQCARDHPFSSFARCVCEGLYEEDWGCLERGGLGFEDVLEFVGMD
jgi:putative transposase